MYREKTGFLILFLATFLLMPLFLTGQQDKQKKKEKSPFENEYKIAQSYENAGEHKRALDIYRRLYKAAPNNPVFFNGMKRTMLFLKMYPELVDLIESKLKEKADINLTGELGDIYYQWGETEKAKELWDSIIQMDPSRDFSYIFVYNHLVQNRLFDDAIQILLKGRATLGDDNMFASNLGYLYFYRKNFEASTREYLKLMRVNLKFFNTVNNYVSRFPVDSTTFNDVFPVLLESVRDNPKILQYRNLLVNLYMKYKKYDRAFSEYKIIDRLQGAKGNEIIKFANIVLNDNEFEMAVKVFSYFIENYSSHNQVNYAEYGLAYCYENLKTPADNDVIEGVRTAGLKAVEQYVKVIQNAKQPSLKAEAQYRIGEIKFLNVFDLDGAIDHYSSILDLYPNTTIFLKALLRLGDVFTAKGNLERAGSHYGLVRKANPKLGSHFIENARFKLGELRYFSGEIDTSLSICNKLLNEISKNSEFYNDLFEFTFFIEEHKGVGDDLLKKFAGVQLLIRQKKYTESLEILEKIYELYPDQPLSDDFLYNIIELYYLLNKHKETLAQLNKFTAKYPESVLIEKAYKKIGEIYEEKLNDRELSLKEYEEFLIKFPGSIYIDEVRKRIRNLEKAQVESLNEN